jgi:hypothetical protein
MNFLQIKNDFDDLVKSLQKQIFDEVELYKKTDSEDFRQNLMSEPNYCIKSIDFVESFLKNIDQNVINLQKRIDELKKIEYEFLGQPLFEEMQLSCIETALLDSGVGRTEISAALMHLKNAKKPS